MNFRPGPPSRYAVALAAVAVATGLRLLLVPALGTTAPYITYFGALTVAALFGGLGPGLVAATMGAIGGAWLFGAKTGSVAAYAVLTPLLVGLCASQRSARRMAEERRAWLAVTLASIGDAVIAADVEGRVTFINTVAERLTGWTAAEAAGRPLAEVLRIVDARDRRPAEDPVARLRREGRCVGLGEHAVLIARDGAERPVDDGAAPIVGEGGAIVGVVLVFRDVTARRRAEAESRRHEALMGRLIQSDHFGVTFGRLDGRISFANDYFLRMVGYGRDDLTAGRLRWDVLRPPESPEPDDGVERMLVEAGGEVPHFEKAYARKDGSRVTALVGASLLPGVPGEGREETVVGFFLDLTERKRAEEALRAARDAAEAGTRARDQFLAMLSHELRNPLMPVLAAASAMLDDPETPEPTRATLELTRRNVELEARLIDDLLDVTRIAEGKLRIDRRPADAHDLIRRALEISRDEIAAKGLALEVDLAAAGPIVEADPARVQQVAWNLIKNAAKFTPEGGRVAVRTRNEPAEGGGPPGLVLEVSDTGIGIDPAALPRIFDAFEQADPGITQRFGGLGLGLAISRSLAEAHGGTLSACSDGRGLGATFTLNLPTTPAPALPDAPDRADVPDDEASPLQILLVEDNPDGLRVLSRLLGRRGHRVTAAATMSEAIAAADSGGFDLLISDIGLPDGSGLDLLRRVRPRLGLGAIALSGFGTERDLARSDDAGFDIHLTKPVEFRRLEDAIRQVAARDRTAPAEAEASPSGRDR